jgi:hypothetical protein
MIRIRIENLKWLTHFKHSIKLVIYKREIKRNCSI